MTDAEPGAAVRYGKHGGLPVNQEATTRVSGAGGRSAAMRWLCFVMPLFLAWAPLSLSAQSVLRTIPFYQHSSFGREAGLPSTVWSIAQTPDGFLWLGTLDGLFRFDGITFEHVNLPANLPARSDMVTELAVDRSGNLWIAHDWGGVTLMQHDGAFRDVRLHTAGPVKMAGDRSGAMWIATADSTGMELHRYSAGRLERHVNVRLALPSASLGGILAASDGTLWVDQSDRLFRLPPGAPRFEPVAGKISGGWELAEGPDHRIWLADGSGIRPVRAIDPSARRWEVGAPIYRRSRRTAPQQVLVPDAEGKLWTVEPELGVVRIDPATPAAASIHIFDMRFVTSPTVWAGFRDREGNIWFGTNGGLDRFRPASFAGAKVAVGKDGVNRPQLNITSRVRADVNGSVFIQSFRSLFQASGNDLPKLIRSNVDQYGELCADNRGATWLATQDGLLGIGSRNRGAKIAAPLRFAHWRGVHCEVAGERIWASSAEFLKYERARWTRTIIEPARPRAGVMAMTPDSSGHLVVYLGRQSLYREDGPRFAKIWDRDAISLHLINVLAASGDDILIGGTTGLARYDGKRTAVLPRARYPAFDEISGIAVDPKGVTWLLSRQGLVKLATAELDRAFDRPGLKIHMRVFGADDGLDDSNTALGSNNLALDGRGTLWLATTNGFYWFDPQHLHKNVIPPAVAIRAFKARGVVYPARPGLELPKGTSDLQIDYTALSFANPGRVRFRYRLVGQDQEWVDPGTRRQAIYTNLGPRNYRFEVVAANEDGVWNKTGASVDFTIAPTFLQSRLFLVLCLVALALGIVAALRTWTGWVSARVRSRIEARTQERERIAREIHDTLLQSVQGLIMRFHNIAQDIAATQPAHREMLDALDSADAVVVEGRDRVHELRRWGYTRSLSEVITSAAERLLSPSEIETRVIVEGTERDLCPEVADELLRITDEALFNVLRHAQAQKVVIAIAYGTGVMVLRITDDGIGIAPEIIAQGSVDNHFGLVGMRERANRIGAMLTIADAPKGGTQVKVTIAAQIAYSDRPRHIWLAWRPRSVMGRGNA